MKNPLVSIIIPTFNRELIIKQALDSVISQTYDNWECIVVDDGSNDDSLKVLFEYNKKDSRINYFSRNRGPKGAPTCRNIGLEYSKGDYVIFLDSDDYLLPHCLEKRVELFLKNRHCDFLVFPMGEKFDNKNIRKKEIPKSNNYLVSFLSANLPWQITCPIWKKEILKTINGFKEGYPRFNDPELMIKALLTPKVEFEVFGEYDFDAVYEPSYKESQYFVEKVYKSLLLFIPDTSEHLQSQSKTIYKKHLALYLHLWFKYIYIPSGEEGFKNSFRLINMFCKQNIISIPKRNSLCLRLVIFYISKHLLKHPINKLIDKSIYN